MVWSGIIVVLIFISLMINGASHGGSTVKNPPEMQETQVWSLGCEDPLEREVATHCSILAWEIPWTERSLAGYSSWGHRELDRIWQLKQQQWLVMLIILPCAYLLLYSHRVVSDSLTPWTASCQASLSFTISQSLLKLMSIELVMPFQPSHLLSPPSPPALSLPQHQGLFQWVSSLHQVAKVLELHLQHQSFRWIFRVDFL